MRPLAILLLSILLVSGCDRPQKFEFYELTIITRDAQAMSRWYEEHLGFIPSKDAGLLYHDNLTILLKENKNALHRDTLRQNHNLLRLPGIFKFGFRTNQFDGMIDALQSKNVDFNGSVVYDSTLNTRMAIIKDPDGNNIQLFESHDQHKLKPYFVALIVETIGEQEKWYQVKLPIDETHKRDLEQDSIFIRMLKGEDLVVELIQLEKRSVKAELDYSEIMGFNTIKVRGAKMPFETDHEGNKIVHVD